ncbi:MAG: hypothetical protein ACE5JA_10000 [bacterium]
MLGQNAYSFGLELPEGLDMRTLPFLLLLCFLTVAVGCEKQGDQPGQVQPTKGQFVPPEDRRITDEQSDRYIEAAKLSQIAIMRYQTKRKEFEEKNNLSPDQSELQDTLFLKEHPDVKAEAQRLQKWFEVLMDSVYIKADISDEEFTWVGGALGDTVNREIQKKVEVRLNAFTEELEKGTE